MSADGSDASTSGASSVVAALVDRDGDSVLLQDNDTCAAAAAAASPAAAQESESVARASHDGQGDSSARRSAIPASGPVCEYGPRLAYTYFESPAPSATRLNDARQDVHFFTVDDQLVYLSFYQDSGPLNAACL